MDFDKNVCPIIDVDGAIAAGKQFDIEITLPEDNRNVIYGIVKDCYGDPVCDAVVKLVEIVCDYGKEELRPVSHTFTDKNGDFVFGPLCANKVYSIQIWVDRVKHCKVCTSCKREGKCLKGVKIDCKPLKGPCFPALKDLRNESSSSDSSSSSCSSSLGSSISSSMASSISSSSNGSCN